MLGRVQGQFLAQSTGATAQDLLARMDGHAALGIEGGTLVGLDLAEIAQRQRAPVRRGGRTSFERASLNLRVTGGIAEIVEGALEGSALSASLRGAVSLPDRRCAAVADVVARSAAVGAPRLKPAQFRIDGPLSDLAVQPVPATPEPDPRDGSIPAPNALRRPADAPAVQLPRRPAPSRPEAPRVQAALRRPVSQEAVSTTAVTTPTRSVEAALISGFTPRRTWL